MQFTAIDDAAWESPWRRRRCGEKAVLSLALTVTALAAPAFPTSPLVAIASLAFILGAAKIRLRHVVYAVAAPLAFVLCGAASVAFAVGAPVANAWFTLGPFSANSVTVARAAEVAAHGIAGSLAVMVLALTTPMVDVLTWLRALRVPAALVEVASLTYRLVFVVLSTALAVRATQVARLGDTVGLRRRFDVVASGMGATLVRSWDRSARLARGLELRGFDDALVTTPVHREPSWPLMITGFATLFALWLTAWWCA